MDNEILKQNENLIELSGRIPPALMPKTVEESIVVLANYPRQYYATLKPMSIQDCLKSNVCTLGAFNRTTTNEETGDMAARALVLIMLDDVVSFFNVGKTMTESQMAQTADLILSNFGFLKIDDLKFCFTCAKMQRYGKSYDRLDGNIIIGWIDEYFKERCAKADDLNHSLHSSLKASERQQESFLQIIRKNK